MNLKQQSQKNIHKQYNPNVWRLPEVSFRRLYSNLAPNPDVYLQDSTEGSTSIRAPTKLIEVPIFTPPTTPFVVIFEAKVTPNYYGWVYVYKNGVEYIGAIKVNVSTYITVTNTVSTFAPGDLLQIYAEVPSSDKIIHVRNLKIIGNSYVRPVIPYIIS